MITRVILGDWASLGSIWRGEGNDWKSPSGDPIMFKMCPYKKRRCEE